MQTNAPKPNGTSTFNVLLTLLLLSTAAGAGAAAPADSADPAPAKTSIPWSQLGAKAGAEYHGDGLSVSATPEGARLRCVFQRLEGEATREGLWLTSTVTNAESDRFRIVASAVGRQRTEPATLNSQLSALPRTGHVAVEGQLVRFSRPGLVEEYRVSLDGVRQDFIIAQRPEGEGELRVEMAVSGARAEPAASGAQLVLEKSGRKIAYSRLRVTDATGKESTARLEVLSAGDEVTSSNQKRDAG